MRNFLFITFIALFHLQTLWAQPQAQVKPAYLAYCHQQLNFDMVWFVNETHMLGRLPDGHTLLWLNRQGLVADTLDCPAFGEGVDVVSDLILLPNNQFLLNGVSHSARVAYTDQALQVLESTIRPMYTPTGYIAGNVGTWQLGYTKAPLPRSKRKRKQYVPQAASHWVRQVGNGSTGKSISLNKADTARFSQWPKRLNSGSIGNTIYYQFHNHTLFVDVTELGEVWMFDTLNQTVNHFRLPPLPSGQQWRYVYDTHAQTEYAVHRVSSSEYRVYKLAEQYKKLEYITTVARFDQHIINGFVHQLVPTQENGKTFYCHYLVPLDHAPDTSVLLEDILIKD